MKRARFLIAVFCLMFFAMADAASASIVTINSDNTLSINGKKTFPQIMYYACGSSVDGYSEPCTTTVQRLGSNYTVNYHISNLAYELNTVIPSLRTTGMMTTMGVWQNNKTIREDPLFFGYLGADEYYKSWITQNRKDGYGQTWADYVNNYNARHKDDPNHPVFINIASGTEQMSISEALTAGDIVMFSSYPQLYTWTYPPKGICTNDFSCTYHQDWFFGNQFGIWSSGMRKNESKNLNAPLYIITHTGGANLWYGALRFTEQEARAQTWLGITMNFKGVGYWAYKDSNPEKEGALYSNDAQLQIINKIAGEIKGLNDVLILPTLHYQWYYHRDTYVSFDKEILPITPYFSNPPWKGTSKNMNYILKQDGNTYYLIIENVAGVPMTDVTISISGLSGSMMAKTLGTQTSGSSRAGRTISVNNGKFLEPKIDGFAVHIYQICSGTCPELPTNPIDTNPPLTTQLSLKPGWNQISSPIAAGINLAAIESSCTILPYKNQKLWAWNATAQVWINPTKVEPFRGYWIYSAYTCTVPLSGTLAKFTSLNLSAGWNKISASGTFSAMQGTCAGHITGNWVWHWDKANEKWIHPATMELSKGYWIKVDQNCILGG